MKTIAFLCEFGGKHGWGHLIRCSALAQAASKFEWKSILAANGPKEAMPKEVFESFDEHSFIQDFDSLPKAALKSDVLFVDFMYWPDEGYERMRKVFNPESKENLLLVATDDMQKRSLASVDVVINSEVGLREAQYKSRIQLLGEKYCYLRSGFSSVEPHRSRLNLDKPISVFIMIGGTDPWNLSVPVLRELESLDMYSFSPVLLSGEQLSNLVEVKACLERFTNARWLNSLSSSEMARCIASCDVAIVACGSSVFELAALNVPFVGLSIVDNQTATAKKISEHWKLPILHIEERKSGQSLGIAQALESLLKNKTQYSNPYSKVDTGGCIRIMKTLGGLL